MIYRPWTRADEIALIGLGIVCAILLGILIYFGVTQ